MEQINSLILYKDWLILDRGNIAPRVGDKIKLTRNDFWCEKEVKEIFESYMNIQLKFSSYSTDWEYLTKCYVEVPYPIIEWKEHPTYSYILIGYVNSIKTELRIVGYEVQGNAVFDECSLYKDNIIVATKGNLEYCKQAANKLLYGITE